MYKFSALLICLTAGLSLSSFLRSGETANSTPAENYANYCSGCHGAEMIAFVDRQWKKGSSKEALISSIKIGDPAAGMPAFAKTFSSSELNALADYILEGIKRMDKYKPQSRERPVQFNEGGMKIRAEKIADGIDVPWGMDFLPDGKILASNRSGDIYLIEKNGEKSKIAGQPPVIAQGQGGMMDIRVHPDFKKNHLIFIAFSKGKNEGGQLLSTTAVMRAEFRNNELINPEIIFEAMPYLRTRHHYGSRIAFDKQNRLYISVGDRGNHVQNFPQQLDNAAGKIHRINDDGSIPSDNPFKQNGHIATIFSYGHRNPQGLSVDAEGNLWANEHGPRGGDELNLVEKGKNYGWPVISYGLNYNGTIITNKTVQEGMQQPAVYWTPSIAPSGLCYVQGNRYPKWKSALLTGSLRFNYLQASYYQNGKIYKEEMILKDIGRVRNIVQSPDGFLYVAVENPGAIYRLVPQP